MSALIDAEVMPQFPGCTIEAFSNMDEWLQARNRVIGASEAASIFSVGYADESPMSVWARKLGKVETKEDTELLECGRVLQSAIIELFRRRYRKAYPDRTPNFSVNTLGEYTLCRSVEHPWLGASLDDHFVDDEGLALVEAKNVSLFMSGDWDDDAPPLKFHIQSQQQMAVTGTNRCFVVGLIGGNRLKWREAQRNQPFIDAMLKELKKFWHYVETETEPPADESEATKKVLGKLHPLDNGICTVLSLEANEWAKELEEIKPRCKELEDRKQGLENALRQAIGDNTYGLLFSGERYSLKTQTRKSFVMPESTYRVLRLEKARKKRK